ncbi:glycosyltransferase 1 domain-containing protein 1-like [Crassostrea virginica]
MTSTILFLSPLLKASGNYSTIKRIRSHLESDTFVCMEWDTADISDDNEFLMKLQGYSVDFIVALHAYKAGRYLSEKVPVPCILIFGGTDVNECYTDVDKLKIMTRAVEVARYVISFSPQMMDRALQIWPDLDRSKAVIIKQGIQTKASSLNLRNFLVEQGHMSSLEAEKAFLFLFVGSIRRVKDPLYLVNMMAGWHEKNKDIFYVMIGPKQDEEYFISFERAIYGKSGIIYLGEMDIRDVHACMRDSDALVNSSESEGMAHVILESMDLGTPVLARRNNGNEALIQHGISGFLFSSPEEFKEVAETLIQNGEIQRKVTIAAKEQIQKEHLPETEREAYLKIINNLNQ